VDEALPIESLAGVPGAPARSQLSPKYWAFVSYSHHDQTWGDWLHKALETYRVPYKLVGRSSPHGKIPRRLFPIFRDCFELPAAGNLDAQLDEALQRSRYLVVVCSPSAAASRWVNEEIRTFKIIGSEDRVLALIVEGEPNASVRSDGKELECFPPALRFRVTPDGKISKTPAEPIAADVRPGQDSKAAAKLRLDRTRRRPRCMGRSKRQPLAHPGCPRRQSPVRRDQSRRATCRDRRDGRSHCDLGPVSPCAIAESPWAWNDGECRSLQP
jgi:MTH538 TIR-like domain (DUF1863)